MKMERTFYKKVEYHRKIGQAIASTLLVLGIATMSVYPESHSKYITSGKVELGSATLYPKEQGTLVKDNFKLLGNKDTAPPAGTNYNSNETNAYINVSFTKNAVDNVVGDTHEYKIKTPTCNIVYVNGGKVSGTVSEYIISSIQEENQVIMKCNVKNNTIGSNLRASIEIEETVEDVTFTYKTGEFIEDIEIYKNKYFEEEPPVKPEIIKDKNSITIPTSLMNEDTTYSVEFLGWLDMINEDYTTNIRSYIVSQYSSLASLKSDQKNPSIKFFGPNTTGNAKDAYKLEIVRDNLEGYAKTYRNYLTNPNIMYFSSTDSTVVQDAFVYYLNHYKYPMEDATQIHPDAQLILDYIEIMSENKGISYLMEKDELGNLKHEIPGIKYDPEGQTITLEDTLLTFAYTRINSIIKLSYDDSYTALVGYDEMLRKIFKFEDYEITLLEGMDILNLILTKPTEKFDKFFVYNAVDPNNANNSSYLLVHMYSEDLSSVFIEVTKVPFEKTENALTLTVDIANYKTTEITDLTTVIKELFKDKKVEFKFNDTNDKIIYTITDLVSGDDVSDDESFVSNSTSGILNGPNMGDISAAENNKILNEIEKNEVVETDKIVKEEDQAEVLTDEKKTEKENVLLESDVNSNNTDSTKKTSKETVSTDVSSNTMKQEVSKEHDDSTLDTKLEKVDVTNTTSNVDIGAPPSGGTDTTPNIGIEEVASSTNTIINNIEPVLTG